MDYVGSYEILWPTDYPHPDGFFQGASAQIAEKPPESQRRMAPTESVMQFYNLS